MAFGLGLLRWPPEAFWRATPRELAAAMAAFGLRGPGGAITRGALTALMARHPDRFTADKPQEGQDDRG